MEKEGKKSCNWFRIWKIIKGMLPELQEKQTVRRKWFQNLENTCNDSYQEKKKEVINY